MKLIITFCLLVGFSSNSFGLDVIGKKQIIKVEKRDDLVSFQLCSVSLKSETSHCRYIGPNKYYDANKLISELEEYSFAPVGITAMTGTLSSLTLFAAAVLGGPVGVVTFGIIAANGGVYFAMSSIVEIEQANLLLDHKNAVLLDTNNENATDEIVTEIANSLSVFLNEALAGSIN